MQGVGRKRGLLEDLEIAERVEALRLQRLRRVDEGLTVLKRVCGASGLSEGARARLVRDLFEYEDDSRAEAEAEAAAPTPAAAVDTTTTTTTLTHLSAAESEEDEEGGPVSPGYSPCEAEATPEPVMVVGPGSGPVTVAGMALELGLHDALRAGGRKGLGKMVSKAWRAEHGGEEPAKFRQPWGRGVRVVNAYGEGDRALIERVARGYAARREHE
jgi:hypothetical protein